MRCDEAAGIARLIAKDRASAQALEAAGQLERHYRKECACYGITDDTIGFRKSVHIDWNLFEEGELK